MVFATAEGKPFRKIVNGAHFGELSILLDIRRTETAIAT